MDYAHSYFEQAAEVLQRAMKASNVGEQAKLLEEALRLNRLALAHQRSKLSRIGAPAPGRGR